MVHLWGWAYRDNPKDTNPVWKWVYASKAFGDFDRNTLNAGCDINMNNYHLRNVSLELRDLNIEEGKDIVIRCALPVSIGDDGTVQRWHPDCYLNFREGILQDVRIE